MPFAVVDLFEIRIVGDILDAPLQPDNFIVARQDGDGAKLQPFGEGYSRQNAAREIVPRRAASAVLKPEITGRGIIGDRTGRASTQETPNGRECPWIGRQRWANSKGR